MTTSGTSPFVATAQQIRRLLTAWVCAMTWWVPALASSGVARAEDAVTYEVVSDSVAVVTIEYQDLAGRVPPHVVTLPWRMDTVVSSVRGAPPEGSQVRADWRPIAAPNRWVSVRISYRGEVICQNTLDIGDAACYGVTARIT